MRLALTLLAAAALAAGCGAPSTSTQPAAPSPDPDRAAIERGRQLVEQSGCHDCHTPKVFGPEGPTPDGARLLIGHPADEALPEPPSGTGPWAVHANGGGTAWAGPWGVSYAANLTPDPATGFGNYTADAFVRAMRTGRQFGAGRPILPPMPWQAIGRMSDDDLKAMHAYLHSLAPAANRVPPARIAPPPAPPAP
jgi:mono/diheme cytochrome c family protein